MKLDRHIQFTYLAAGFLALLILLTIPTVFTAIAFDRMKAEPEWVCRSLSGKEVPCPEDK